MACLKKLNQRKERLRLLIVEDNDVLQTCLIQKLKALNCDVVLATSGEEAVEKFSPNFDGVLMDLGLPGMSGYEATETIRQNFPEVTIPIMASTTQSPSCLKACVKKGMNGLLQKPWNEDEMTEFLMALEKNQRIDNGSYLRSI